jgi:hypothetical protein
MKQESNTHNPSKFSAHDFLNEYVEPVRKLLPLAKIQEFTEHAHKIERSFKQDAIHKTSDYLQNQILLTAKERLNNYITKRITSKSITNESKLKLTLKLKDANAISNLARFIMAFQLIETMIEKLQPIEKKSFFAKMKSLIK